MVLQDVAMLTTLSCVQTDPDINPESDYKCYYVFKGPTKMEGSKLYYVYGKGFDVSW